MPDQLKSEGGQSEKAGAEEKIKLEMARKHLQMHYATISKLQQLLLGAQNIDAELIELTKTKEFDLAHLLPAFLDLSDFQVKIREEIKRRSANIDEIEKMFTWYVSRHGLEDMSSTPEEGETETP